MSQKIARLGDEGYILKIDPVSFMKMLMQTAASVLTQIPTMPIGNTKSEDGLTAVLAKYVNWASDGYVNSLQTQVEFLYEAIPFVSEIDYHFGVDYLIIADALTAYQQYKTRVVEESQRRNGKDFGRATEFNKKDWTDRNHLIK